MTAKQLKNSILKEAVQGKLVSQNNKDEPSSELLKRIKAERDKQIKAGKIKPNKNISSIYRNGNSFYEKKGKDEICIDAELPFEIPKSWEWIRLGNFALNYDGKRKPVSVELRNKQEKIYDYYGATGIIDKVENYIFDGTFVLVGEDGGNFYSDKDVAFIVNGTFWANNHVHVLGVYSGLESYFCYYLNSLNLPAMGFINGIAVPKLNQANLNKILIPIPPIEEQKRIVNKLNELMPLIEEYEKLETELNELDKKFPERLKKSILKEAFDGKLIKSSNKLKIKTLEEVCIYSSSNIALKDIKNKKGDYPVYGASGVVGYSDFYSKEKECVAVVKDGSVGKVFLLPAKSSVISTLHYLENTELLDIKYLYYFLQSINFLKYKIGAMIPHIYFRDYKKEKILIRRLKNKNEL